MDPADAFDFYLDHYKEQLAAGYVKVGSDNSLRAFLKDYSKVHPSKPPAPPAKPPAGAANVSQPK
jgi:hypothetical protein